MDKIREYSDEHIKIALVANKKDLVDSDKPKHLQVFKDILKEEEEEAKSSPRKRI